MSKNKDPTLVHRKVAILGFRAVGKSSLTNSFMTGTFSDDYDPTIESTHHKTIRFRKVHFATDIVDTAGMVSRAGGSLTFGTTRLWISFDYLSCVCLYDVTRTNSLVSPEMLR